jgi:ABC-type multidrug transport system ATPase subunit
MQDDAFIETLTVSEILYYQLSLRRTSFEEIEKYIIIESILETLNLVKVKDTRVGSPLNRYIQRK